MPDFCPIFFKFLFVVLVVLSSIKAVLTILDMIWKSVFDKDSFFSPTMKANDRFLVEIGKTYKIRFLLWDIDDGNAKFALFARMPGSLDVLVFRHNMVEMGQSFFRGHTKAEAQDALKAYLQEERTYVCTDSYVEPFRMVTIPKCSTIEELHMKFELTGKEN